MADMRLRSWRDVIPLRLRSLVRRRAVEHELDEELAFHLEMTARQEMERGLDADAARLAAARRFGGVELQKDACRDTRGFAPLEAIAQDARHAWRALRRSPGYALTAIAALAIGLGATAALTAAVDAMLIKPLPLPGVERMRWLSEARNGEESNGSPARLRDWAALPIVEHAAGLYSDSPVVRELGAPERIDTMRMVGPLLETMGLQTVAGRMPTPEETRGAGDPVVLLSHRFWQQRLGARADALGSTLTLDGRAFTVIGVLPPAAEQVFDVELWAPAAADQQNLPRTAHFLSQVVRLAPNVSDDIARAALSVALSRLAQDHPDTDRGRTATLSEFASPERRGARLPLLVLLGAALLVLLVSTLNVAALSLTRGIGRLREASLRVALGAGRMRLVQLHLIESGMLAAAGVVAGLVVASLGLDLLKAGIPSPRLATAAIDVRLLSAAAVLAVACTLIVGALPALLALRCASAPVLREGGPQSAGPVRSRWRGAIVVAEVALAVAGLSAASLLTRSLVAMAKVPLGFVPEHTLSFVIPPSFSDTAEREPVRIANLVVDRARTWPGVQSVGVADRLPLGGGAETSPVRVNGVALAPELDRQSVEWRTATAGFFGAAGVPLLRGSLYAGGWDTNQPREALVNDVFVRRYLGGADPIGREVARVRGSRPDAPLDWFRIVGVVGGVRIRPTQLEPAPQVYVPWGATGWPVLRVVIRTTTDPETLIPAVRLLSRSLGDDVTIENVQTLHAHLDEIGRERRLQTGLINGFAAVALALAVLGLYGLLAAEVAARRQEIGVRLTLGARPRQLLAATCLRGLRFAALGLLLGMAATPLIARAISGLLVGVSPDDWAAPAITCAVLLMAAALASFAPALRASRVDPASALRHD